MGQSRLKRIVAARAAVVGVAVMAMMNLSAQAGEVLPCEPEWMATVTGAPPFEPVRAVHVFDNGAGEALYVSGEGFVGWQGPTNRVMKWEGQSWISLGDGLNWDVLELATITVNGKPTLAAGGAFGAGEGNEYETYVAIWDGQGWTALTSGLRDVEDSSLPTIRAIEMFDDGGGPALFAGGNFTHAGESEIANVARWNGYNWEPLAGGSAQRVWDLVIFDDQRGGGPALYASGSFSTAGGALTSKVGRWDGSSWEPIGFKTELIGTVHALEVFDDGSGLGPTLFLTGPFVGDDDVFKLVGDEWIAVGQTDFVPYSLKRFDDGTGSGTALYMGGRFGSVSGVQANCLAKWNGAEWSPVPNNFLLSGSPAVYEMVAFAVEGVQALMVGGDFFNPQTFDGHITRWQGCALACPGDIAAGSTFASDPDGVIDSADLAFLISEWGPNAGSPADIVTAATFAPPPDGFVDAADLAFLLGEWGLCE